MYVINFTIFVCGISEECVSASTNKKRGSQWSHLGMETNPPICWVHCHSLPFLAIPFENRLICPFLAIPRRSSPFIAIPLNQNAPPKVPRKGDLVPCKRNPVPNTRDPIPSKRNSVWNKFNVRGIERGLLMGWICSLKWQTPLMKIIMGIFSSL